MGTIEKREILLKSARAAYPDAISVDDPKMRSIANGLVREKLLHKGKFREGIGYRLAETESQVFSRERSSGPKYEPEVSALQRKLRKSKRQKPKR